MSRNNDEPSSTDEAEDQRSDRGGDVRPGERRHPVIATIFRIVICLVVLGIGGGIAAALTLTAPSPGRVDRSAEATPVIAIEPLDERVARRWRGFGTLQSSMTSMVPSRVASTVESVRENLEVGLQVKEGESIVTLDSEDYRRQADSAGERLVQIDAEIDRLDQELKAALERQEISQREYELSERDLARVRDAQSRGAAVPREIDTAEQKVLAVRGAMLTIDELITTLPMRRRVLVAQRDQLSSEQRIAESQVERCDISAPFDGVVASVLVEIGEQVGPGTPIARIFDPSLIELPLRIPASARGRVAAGDRVVINRTVIDQPIEATVTRLAPEDDSGSRTMTIFVELDSLGGRVVPGLFVHGEVIEGESVRRAIVPRRSVVNQRVMLIADGTIRFVAVKTLFPLNETRPGSGLADTQWLVLEEPLPDDMLLVVDGGRAFEEGMRVAPKIPDAGLTGGEDS